MAFKASNIVLSRAYDEIKREAAKVKNDATSMKSAISANVTAGQILALAGNLRSARINMEARASSPGIAGYAQSQEDDATYNVSVEYTAMLNQIDSVLAWVSANLPTNNGYLQVETLNADGSITYREFTPAQTLSLGVELDSLISVIE